MIRVVHVITDLNVGGAELALYRLLAASDQSRMAASVISLTDVGPVGERIRALGLEVRALDMQVATRVPRAPLQLFLALREARPDVVQTWMYHADLFGGLAARMAGVRHTVWGLRMSDIAPGTEKWTTQAVVRASARVSRSVPARILCCSEAVRRAHVDIGYAPERMVVIGNGFETRDAAGGRTSLREELGLPEDVPVIGRVGRFHPMKDYATFAAAAGLVQRHVPEARFVMCGRDVVATNRELVGMFEAAGVRGLHLLGRRDDMDRVYGTLDVLCSSSSSGEGFPNVIGEAMSHGVPVVTTDVGDSANIVGTAGAVVPPADPQALGRALVDLLEMEREHRRRLGEQAQARIRDHFSMERMVSGYEALYRGLLS